MRVFRDELMESIFLIHNRVCLIVMKTVVVIYLRMETDDGNELVEIDLEVRQLGFVVTP
jgi:hypothetical protein